nr:Ig-like domain-containing protein [Pseudomonas sp. FFPRI_1]
MHISALSTDAPTQMLVARPNELYVLVEQQQSLDDLLLAERAGDDLLLSFKAQESASPAVALEQFFSQHNSLHLLRADGELTRVMTTQGTQQQGEVSFALDSLGSVAQMTEHPALGLLHGAMHPSDESQNLAATAFASAMKSASLAAQSVAEEATMVIEPAAQALFLENQEMPLILKALDRAGEITGELRSGGFTDDARPLLMGTGTPNTSLILFDNGEPIDEILVDASGNWTFELEGLIQGGHVLWVQAGSGTETLTSPNFTLVLDSSAPAQATIDSINEGSSSGPQINSGSLTTSNKPTFSGQAEAFATVLIYNNGELIGTTVARANGTWEFSTRFFSMLDGEYNISVAAMDAVGNVGLVSPPYQITIDTLPPSTPTIDLVEDNIGKLQGNLTSGDFTDDSKPVISGSAEAHSIVSIYDNGVLWGTVQAGANGVWVFNPDTPLSDAKHELTIRAKDAAGNLSAPSAPWVVIVDTAPIQTPGLGGDGPGLHEVVDNFGPVTGPILNGGETDSQSPTLNGSGKPGDTVIIRDNGEVIGEVVVDEDGKWTFTPELEEGEHKLDIIIQDEIGRQSEPSPEFVIKVDSTTRPDAPSIDGSGPGLNEVIDNFGPVTGPILNGGETDSQSPTLNGSGKPGDTVIIRDNGEVIGEVVVDEDGKWTFTPELEEGEHKLDIIIQDEIGRQSDPSPEFVIKVDSTTRPDAPSIDGSGPGLNEVIDNFGPVTGPILNGGETDSQSPTLNGSGKPGDTVIIRDNGEVIGEVVVDEDGKWTFTPELEEGEHKLDIIIQDEIGRQSEPSPEFVIKVDSTTRPDAPSIDGSGPGLNEVIDNFGPVTGPILNGGETDSQSPTLNGSGKPGDTVIIRDNGNVIGEVVVDEDGKWTFTPELEEGEHKLDIIIQDEIGRQSDPSPEFVIKVDSTTRPDAPSIDGSGPGLNEVIDNFGPVTGPILNGGETDSQSPTLNGSGKPGDTVIIRDNGEVIGEVVVDEDGKWTFTPELEEGEHKLDIIIQDEIGRQSEPSPEFVIKVDSTTRPDAPSIDGSGPGLNEVIDNFGPVTGPILNGGETDSQSPTLNGSGKPGDTVIIRDNGNVIGEVVVDEDGKWTFTPELEEGEHKLDIIIQDEIGRQSEPSPEFVIKVDSTTRPDAPSIDGSGPGLNEVIDNFGPVTGPILNGGETDSQSPILNGSGKPGDTVIIRDNGNVIGEVVVDEDGKWTFTPELEEGEHKLDIIIQDEIGRQSEPSPEFVIKVDITPPNDPVLGGEGHGLHEIIDDAGEVTGPIAENGVTDDNTPTFKGTGEVGDTVIIRNGNEEIGRVVITEADGSWSFTPETELADGNYAFNVIMQDPASNQSKPSPSWNVKIDTVAPNDPVLGDEGHGLHEIIDDAGEVTGPLAENGITDDNTPTFKGTGVVGDTVIIRNGSEEIGRVVITEADGSWSFTPETELADGNYAFNVIMQNPLGNQSKPSPSWNVEIDTVAPSDPVLGDEGHGLHEIIDDAGEVTGPIAENGVTDDNTPTFKGTGVVGDTVIIRNGSEEIGRAVVGEDGSWSFTPETELADGNYAFNVVMQDPAGNQSNPSPSWNVEIDTVAPSDPVLGDEGHGLHEIIDDAGEVTGPIAENGVTDDTTPTFKGTGVVGDTVIIRNGNEEIGRVVITEADGSWSFTPETELADGNYAFNVIMQNPLGNQSQPSPNWNVEIDTVAPSDPVLGDEGHGLHEIIDDAGEVTGPIAENGVTDDNTPTFKGTGVVGDTVIIRNGSEEIGRVVITEADGSWSFTPETALADGNYAFNVVMQDPAGNPSNPSPSWNVEIDTVAPSDPVLGDEGHGLHEIIDDAGEVTGPIAENGITDDSTPTFKGTGVVGDTVIIRNGNEEIGRVVITEADGSWSFTPETELADGNYAFNVVMQNPLGNQSKPSPSWNVEIDTVAPSDPVLGDEGHGLHEIIDDAGSITGPIAEDGITDDNTPTFKGTGVVGDTVIIRNGSEEIGRVVITEADGSWSFTPETELADGNYAFNVVMQDPAGNQSKPSPSWNVEIDTVPPSDPVLGDEGHGLHEIIDDAGSITGPIAEDGITDDTTPTFKGTGVVGDTVIIRNGSEEIGRVVITEADGSWSFTPETELADGNYAFNVVMQDPAGNPSNPSPSWNVEINSQGQPETPTIESVFDDIGTVTGNLTSGDVTDDNLPRISGKTEPGNRVMIYNHGQPIGEAEVDQDGKWSFTPETELSDGEYQFTAVAINGAGTRSDASAAFDMIIYTGNGPSQVAKLLHMGKDSGMDGADFVTNNGSAGRLMHGELSGALEAGQRLQVSTDGGRTWSDALVNGTQWAIQDKTAHTSSWSIQTRVLDVDGNSGYVMKQSVTFDNIATLPVVKASFAGTELVIDLPTSSLSVGDRVLVFGDRGAQYFEHILTQEDLLAGSVRMEVGTLNSASVALADAAGNMTPFTNVSTPVPPSVIYTVTGEESEIYGTNSRADTYAVSDVSLLDKVKLIEGNGGIDTLRLTGSDQVLDLSQLKTRLSSIENFDITGTGDNTLKLSLGDVLEQGATGMYISSNSIQVAVRGDAGDVVQLSDLLPNGMDGGSWVHNSQVVASGITYEVYHNSTMNADLLVQAGVTVEMV